MDLHKSLCNPGITRMLHFVRCKNLPYSVNDVKSVISNCKTCAERKLKFYKPTQNKLIKVIAPFEGLNIDFKGPLPSVTSNKYLFTTIDEYSRFPFAFDCPDMTFVYRKHMFLRTFCCIRHAFVHSFRSWLSFYVCGNEKIPS